MASELAAWAKRAAVAIYLATDEVVADDISPRLREVAARLSAQEEQIERMRKALKDIVDFCDDPHGSEKPESLAMGLARLLPAGRAALEGSKRDG